MKKPTPATIYNEAEKPATAATCPTCGQSEADCPGHIVPPPELRPMVEHKEAAPITDPFALMVRATEMGMSADQLKTIADLHRQWVKDQAESAYNAAMSECQAEMPNVIENAQNAHTKSTYANLEMVNKTIKPVYTKHGFSLSFTTEDGAPAGFYRTICRCGHKGGHSTTHRLDLPIDGAGSKGGATAMNAVQAGGSTMSYGRRYLTLMIFNVTVGGEDDDAQGGFLTDAQTEAINLEYDAQQHKRTVGPQLELFRKWWKEKYLPFAADKAYFEGISLNDVPRHRFDVIMKDLEARKEKNNGWIGPK